MICIMHTETHRITQYIPFEMKLPPANPVAISNLAKEQFDAGLRAGIEDIKSGNDVSADDVEAEMRGD